MAKTNNLLTVQEVVSLWNLNRPILAAKMGMPVSTFKNKINPNLPAYYLTDIEEQKLKDILKALTNDIASIK